MMSSMPRVMPPAKSPALKRGVTALAMITLDSASVSPSFQARNSSLA
jgi:hypothetical protein